MASLLEQMITAQRIEKNKNALHVNQQNSLIKSLLNSAQTCSKLETKENENSLNIADIKQQIKNSLYKTSRKDLFKIAIFCATTQNPKAEKILISKVKSLIGKVRTDDYIYVKKLMHNQLDFEILAKVDEYLANNLEGYKQQLLNYATTY